MSKPTTNMSNKEINQSLLNDRRENSLKQGSDKGQVRLVRQQRPERLPLSYAQQRLWFLDRMEGKGTVYNFLEALRLRGELDLEALERTINTIVERHESLRTRV